MSSGDVHRATLMEVYRQWWAHDAHWYQGVAKRFGQQAANEINAEALRQVAVQVGNSVGRQAGDLTADGGIAELRSRYEQCGERMFPRELRSATTEAVDDDVVELTVRRNFAITMLRMAASLEGYECPCTDIHAGWSEGLGVTLTENRATACLRFGDPACRLVMRVETPVVPSPELPPADGGSAPAPMEG